MGQNLDPTSDVFQQRDHFDRGATTISATITLAIATIPARFRITKVEIIVDATYVADAADYYAFSLVHGSGPTTAATYSTQTGQNGAITAAVPGVFTLSATDANRVAAASSVLKLVATKNGSAANITPRIVVHGRYVATA